MALKISVNLERYCTALLRLGQPIGTFLPGKNLSWKPSGEGCAIDSNEQIGVIQK
jgi:hypothetical protein